MTAKPKPFVPRPARVGDCFSGCYCDVDYESSFQGLTMDIWHGRSKLITDRLCRRGALHLGIPFVVPSESAMTSEQFMELQELLMFFGADMANFNDSDIGRNCIPEAWQGTLMRIRFLLIHNPARVLTTEYEPRLTETKLMPQIEDLAHRWVDDVVTQVEAVVPVRPLAEIVVMYLCGSLRIRNGSAVRKRVPIDPP